jgi:integrase
LYFRAGEPGQPRRQVSAQLGDVRDLPNVTAARQAADRYLERVDPRRLHGGSAVTWPSWCATYMTRHLVLLSRGSRQTRASIIRRHLAAAPSLKDLELHRIDVAACQEFIIDQHAAGAAASTTRARFALLRTMLRTAAAAGLAVSPPLADQVRFPKDETAPVAISAKAFTPAEGHRILEAAADPLATVIALARFIGLRASEICGLTWDAIDIASGRVEVRQQALGGELRPLKSKSSRATLRAPTPLLTRLRTYRETWPPNVRGLLFADEHGSPADPVTFRRELHDLLERLGIPRRGLHAFRHACALAMAAAGVNPEALRRAMRHAGIRTTAIYLSASPEDIAAALDAAALIDGKPLGADHTMPQQIQPCQHSHLTREGTNGKTDGTPA